MLRDRHLVFQLLCCLLQITVDGDTSTNDTVIGLASGKAGSAPITDASSADGKVLESALTALLQVGWRSCSCSTALSAARQPLLALVKPLHVTHSVNLQSPHAGALTFLQPLCITHPSACHIGTDTLRTLLQGLAKSIAWDGEGATCLMEVEVTGAKSDADARTAAKSVAGSSLVKSAIFGHDPNWGRIAAAAGYSGELLLWCAGLRWAALSNCRAVVLYGLLYVGRLQHPACAISDYILCCLHC
jgi:hypothetical protein